jgi:predicted alpha/beta superfamily hydrolase
MKDAALKMFRVGAMMLAAFGTGGAQRRVMRAPVATHTIRASATGVSYELFISLPDVYGNADTTRYDVLYVLDGNDLFPLARATIRDAERRDGRRQQIIVGVGYVLQFNESDGPARWADLTPTADVRRDAEWLAQHAPPHRFSYVSGRGPAFLDVLREQVIPFIGQTYRVTPERTLFGHSLGGLFATYVLLTEPTLFSGYAISSPSLWWDHDIMIRRAESFSALHSAVHWHAFISVGAAEDSIMLAGVQRITAAFAAEHLTGPCVSTEVIEHANHASVIAAALERGERVLNMSRVSPTGPQGQPIRALPCGARAGGGSENR